MTRLIDADALMKPIEESWRNAGLHGEDYRKIKRWINNAPTIEPSEGSLTAIKEQIEKHPYLEPNGDLISREVYEDKVEYLETKIEYLEGELAKRHGDDLISRANAIEAVENQFFGGTVADINRDWQRLHDILKALPSADRLNCEDCEYRMMWKERADDE